MHLIQKEGAHKFEPKFTKAARCLLSSKDGVKILEHKVTKAARCLPGSKDGTLELVRQGYESREGWCANQDQ